MIKEETKSKIQALVEKYNNLSEKERLSYNEQQTKDYFIRPFFEALGWNFENPAEVHPEETISKQRADYGFRINGIPKFFLEAKAIHIDLDSDNHARQKDRSRGV